MIFQAHSQLNSFWLKSEIPNIQFDEQNQVQVLMGDFYKIGRTFKKKCTRTYFLVKQMLFYSDTEIGAILKGFVILDTVYAVFKQQGQVYEIQLNNQGHVITLHTDNQTQFQLWKDALSSTCILNNFEETYQLGAHIGTGSFSQVYKCSKDNLEYAVKIINKMSMKQINKTKQFEQQLLNEITGLRLCNHQNIMQLHRVYESSTKFYLVCEFINGSEIISNSKNIYSADDLTQFIHKTLDALAHIQDNNIMHRDIKPQNILLRNGQLSDPVIIDFGLCAFEWQRSPPFPQCGSPGYSAPEVIKYEDTKKMYNSTCDIFSLGITIFVMVYGYNPFKCADHKTTLRKNQDAYFEIPNYPIMNKQCKIQFKKITQIVELLLQSMTKRYPRDRISVNEALNHPFFLSNYNLLLKLPKQILTKQQYDLHMTKQIQQVSMDLGCGSGNIISINNSACHDQKKRTVSVTSQYKDSTQLNTLSREISQMRKQSGTVQFKLQSIQEDSIIELNDEGHIQCPYIKNLNLFKIFKH